MMPLTLLQSAERAEVLAVGHPLAAHPLAGGAARDTHYSRMEDMGVRVGKTVEMLRNEGRGPVLLKVDESRIAMARGMAMHIRVRRTHA